MEMTGAAGRMGNIIFTIGHSNRSIEEFIELLNIRQIEEVVDVRTVTKSGANPHFNKDELRGSLRKHHIGYRHIKRLGGWRHAKAASPNTGWHNPSFRGYADYMSKPDFDKGLEKLEGLRRRRSPR